MRIQVYGCRGSIPRPHPDMARYGGNTPCIEVVSTNGGHRLIFDLGSGAFDLGQKILGEMFARKKIANTDGDAEGKNLPKLGGSIFITRKCTSSKQLNRVTFSHLRCILIITDTHWDHIQGEKKLLHVAGLCPYLTQ